MGIIRLSCFYGHVNSFGFNRRLHTVQRNRTIGVQKRTSHKLTIYRRHANSCPLLGSPRKLDGCECPLWVHGKLRGESVRKSLDTRSLGEAEREKARLLAGRDDDPLPEAASRWFPPAK
jgi:hypothetical protein